MKKYKLFLLVSGIVLVLVALVTPFEAAWYSSLGYNVSNIWKLNFKEAGLFIFGFWLGLYIWGKK